ncbi:hypothetical protein [Methylomonas sp. AM2-LC]|uniref:hypothetical protein n=1 Tax=Methylomonas sp. AM2-LC TaxID=3153301 RepID=UPI0032635F89
MQPIQVPDTIEKYQALIIEWQAAQFFSSQADNQHDLDLANNRIIECENAMTEAESLFNFDDGGNPVGLKLVTANDNLV